jgi:hypothetical protein
MRKRCQLIVGGSDGWDDAAAASVSGRLLSARDRLSCSAPGCLALGWLCILRVLKVDKDRLPRFDSTECDKSTITTYSLGTLLTPDT